MDLVVLLEQARFLFAQHGDFARGQAGAEIGSHRRRAGVEPGLVERLEPLLTVDGEMTRRFELLDLSLQPHEFRVGLLLFLLFCQSRRHALELRLERLGSFAQGGQFLRVRSSRRVCGGPIRTLLRGGCQGGVLRRGLRRGNLRRRGLDCGRDRTLRVRAGWVWSVRRLRGRVLIQGEEGKRRKSQRDGACA